MKNINVKEIGKRFCDVCCSGKEDYIVNVGHHKISICKDCLKELTDRLTNVIYPHQEESTTDVCSCYSTNFETPRCMGTKDMDRCDCEGDPSKCTFYDYKRNKPKEKNN